MSSLPLSFEFARPLIATLPATDSFTHDLDDEAAFLASIIADPGDDAPRLIYSDWLEENGRSEQALRIRTQIANRLSVETNAIPGFSSVARLVARWRRGLVHELHCSWDWWMANAQRIHWHPTNSWRCGAHAQPLEVVVLEGVPQPETKAVNGDSLLVELPGAPRTARVSKRQVGGHRHVAVEVGTEMILKETWPGTTFLCRFFRPR